MVAMKSHIKVFRSFTYWQKNVFLIITILLIIAAIVLVPTRTKSLAGPSGPSQPGCEDYGHWDCWGAEWWPYSVDGNGPSDGFKNGSSWSTIATQCASLGATTVWAFIVNSRYGGWMSYSWDTGFSYWISDPADIGTASTDTAMIKGYYDLSKDAGWTSSDLTWGSNVGWFCYSTALQGWTIYGLTSVNVNGTRYYPDNNSNATYAFTASGNDYQEIPIVSAKPGDTLQWRSWLWNDGPGKASSGAFTFATSGYGFSNNNFNNTAHNSAATGGQEARTWSQEIGPGTGGNDGWHNAYTTYTVQVADAGNKLCEKISWGGWKNTDGGWRESNRACVQVANNWTSSPDIRLLAGNDTEYCDNTGTPS